MNAYESLTNAVIELAVKDYRKALRSDPNTRNGRRAYGNIAEIERFFRSDFFKAITDINGEYLVRKLRNEVEK